LTSKHINAIVKRMPVPMVQYLTVCPGAGLL
jgi:hypothetical protein